MKSKPSLKKKTERIPTSSNSTPFTHAIGVRTPIPLFERLQNLLIVKSRKAVKRLGLSDVVISALAIGVEKLEQENGIKVT
jgi:hypothetical protein